MAAATFSIEIGEKVYLSGNSSGIEASFRASLLRTKVFLKEPITISQGGEFNSLNVTTRKTLGVYANIRSWLFYHPFLQTKHPVMDVVVVRENEVQRCLTTPKQVNSLVDRAANLGLKVAMTVSLRNYDGQPGYTLAEGR